MKAILATAPLALILAGCNDSPTESAKMDASSTTQRAISPALRATCAPLEATPAARLAVQGVTETPAPLGKLEVSIYDTTGMLIGHSITDVKIPDGSDPRQMAISWDGQVGNSYAPNSHYFEFWTLRDSLGTTLRQDSTCVGLLLPKP